MALSDAIVEAGHNDLNYVVQASCRGIAASPEVARKMARAGFRVIFLGIENMSRRNLRHMSKASSAAIAEKAVRHMRENDILLFAGIIVGLPDDTPEDIHDNYRFLRRLGTDYVLDQVITPYPATETREEMTAEGLVTNPGDFRWYNGNWANVRNRHMTALQIQFTRWKYHDLYTPSLNPSEATKRHWPFVYLYRRAVQIPYERTRRARSRHRHSEWYLFQRRMNQQLRANIFPDLMKPGELAPAVPGGVAARPLRDLRNERPSPLDAAAS
jgi:radical SAM superfamily enzyme YgiQ (UPF0313 family)